MISRIIPVIEETGLENITLAMFDFKSKGVNVPFESSWFSLAPGAATPVDSHDVAESWFIAAGSVSVMIDGENMNGEVGNAILFAPGQLHNVTNIGDCDVLIFSCWWHENASLEARVA